MPRPALRCESDDYAWLQKIRSKANICFGYEKGLGGWLVLRHVYRLIIEGGEVHGVTSFGRL